MKKTDCKCNRPFRGLLLLLAALGAGTMAHAGNILVNPGFESAPIFSAWSAQTTESWSMNAAVGNGDLFRSGANGLWTQGLYLNGGAPAYYNMGAYQTIACAPGATFTADAWYSAYTYHPGHLGGDEYAVGADQGASQDATRAVDRFQSLVHHGRFRSLRAASAICAQRSIRPWKSSKLPRDPKTTT